MGLYDSLPRGSQLKLWDCDMTTKIVGSDVPSFNLSKYVVLLREGGYVIVENGIIIKVVENHGKKNYYPEDFPNVPCFDKWGSRVNFSGDLIEQFQGLAGMDDPYPYYFKE